MTETVFEAREYKESIRENKLLHSLLYGLSKTLEEEIQPGMGYSALSRVGTHMIQYLGRYGFKPIESEDPYERIMHLCRFYTDEGMVRKIYLKKEDGGIKIKAHGLFGSCVFADLHLETGVEHTRPCPLFAMILSQLSEIGYMPKIRKLDYDAGEDLWEIDLEVLKMD